MPNTLNTRPRGGERKSKNSTPCRRPPSSTGLMNRGNSSSASISSRRWLRANRRSITRGSRSDSRRFMPVRWRRRSCPPARPGSRRSGRSRKSSPESATGTRPATSGPPGRGLSKRWSNNGCRRSNGIRPPATAPSNTVASLASPSPSRLIRPKRESTPRGSPSWPRNTSTPFPSTCSPASLCSMLRRGGGFTLNSFGPNGNDDAGRESFDDPPGDDIMIRVAPARE